MIPTEARELINYIDKNKINKSAKKFISSIETQIDRGAYLKPAQVKVLMDIYCQSQGGGVYQQKEYVG